MIVFFCKTSLSLRHETNIQTSYVVTIYQSIYYMNQMMQFLTKNIPLFVLFLLFIKKIDIHKFQKKGTCMFKALNLLQTSILS